MQWVIVLLIVAAAGMVLFSLVRGLVYFARTGAAIQNDAALAEMHMAQNRMMFSRVKWQAITIGLLFLLGIVAASSN